LTVHWDDERYQAALFTSLHPPTCIPSNGNLVLRPNADANPGEPPHATRDTQHISFQAARRAPLRGTEPELDNLTRRRLSPVTGGLVARLRLAGCIWCGGLADSRCCKMRPFTMSALWVPALLAMLVALDSVVNLVHAETMEDRSEYQACVTTPSTCTLLCVFLSPPRSFLSSQRCCDRERLPFRCSNS
jgi:hypothetical protein